MAVVKIDQLEKLSFMTAIFNRLSTGSSLVERITNIESSLSQLAACLNETRESSHDTHRCIQDLAEAIPDLVKTSQEKSDAKNKDQYVSELALQKIFTSILLKAALIMCSIMGAWAWFVIETAVDLAK